MWIWNYFLLCTDDGDGFEDISLYSLTDEESEYHSVQDLEVQGNVEAHISPMPSTK